MPAISAGLLMYRFHNGELQVLLAHPGGPYYRKKDEGVWSIPKGEAEAGEDLLETAKREFEEELGVRPIGPFIPLKPVKQRSGKMVHSWAFAGDCDTGAIVSNMFTMEWPPRSGRECEFPEVDRAEFFATTVAKHKINPAQIAIIEELKQIVRKMS
ncbi:MAG TPA: NUDIX domain-containing protein [Gemmataceae bacterium]|nr:NUDIX domain-containing protein [Gemmataceae bacterium]